MWIWLLACNPADDSDTGIPDTVETDTDLSETDVSETDSGDTDIEDTDNPELEAATAAVYSALEDAFTVAPAGVTGIRLSVRDANGAVLDLEVGDLPRDRRLAVASASKWVTAIVLLRLVEEGLLQLDFTTGMVLGWTGDHADVTLDHLGAFNSGFSGNDTCTYNPISTLADCTETIGELPVVAEPGAWFDYGSTHLTVAGRMAEVATTMEWADLFKSELATPLGLTNPDLKYVTVPKEGLGERNPLLAGGLRITVDEYEAILGVVFNNGQLGDQTWISPALLERFETNAYPDAEMGSWPMGDYGYTYRYGFGSWLECDGAVATCDVISSPGTWGFTPWIDRTAGYQAILAMEADDEGSGAVFAVPLEQDLKPLIEAVLAAR